MNTAQYVKKQIQYMCSTYKDRSGGSASENACQDYMAGELGGYADTVQTQAFTVHPDAGWGWLIIVAVSGIVSIVMPLLNIGSVALSVAAFVASLVAAAITLFQFLMGYHVIDRFFPGKAAKNVFASVAPKQEVRQRIVYAGHADAAYEMTYSHRGGAKKVLRVAGSALVALGISFLLNAVLLIRHIAYGATWRWVRLAMLLLLPAFIRMLFFFNTRRIVDGANDNLSGCAVAMATLQALARPQSRLEHTEVCCLITSSEECGLRGAHAFAEKYAAEADGVDTVFVVLDTLHDIGQLQVYTQGMNGFQRNSGEVAALAQDAGRCLGLDLPEAAPYLGATDAEALSRAGLKACAICGVDHTPQPYYHTRADNADNIDEACLGVCLDLCLEIAQLYDGQEAAVALAQAV